MARDFAQISTTIWDSRKVRSLGSDDAARLFYFYLHTNILVNNVGCYVLKFGAAADDLQWNDGKIAKAMDTLCKANLVGFDREERLVRLVDFLKKFPTGNEKHAIGCVRTALAVPDCQEKLHLLNALMDDPNCQKLPVLKDAIDSLSEAYGNTDTETDTGRETKTDTQTPAAAGESKSRAARKRVRGEVEYSHAFERFWAVYPSRGDARNPKPKAMEAWIKAVERGATAEQMIAAAERYAKTDVAGTKYAAQAVTWLNQDSWKDEAPKVETAKPAEPPPDLKGWRLAFWKTEGAHAYDSYIAPAQVVKSADGTVKVLLPTKFKVDWVRTHYAPKLQTLMQAEDAAVARVVIDLKPADAGE